MKHFFDVPVYRLSRDRYYQERDSYVDEVLFPKDSPDSATLRAMDAADPTLNAFMRNHLPRSYGGCWEFNEIVGYITTVRLKVEQNQLLSVVGLFGCGLIGLEGA